MDYGIIQKKISKYFCDFKGKTSKLWNLYNFTTQNIKYNPIDNYLIKSLYSNDEKRGLKENSNGMKNKFLAEYSNDCFVNMISLFENYISTLCEINYKTFPGLLETSELKIDKLMGILIEKNTKEEILDYIIEEKIRSIFYGKPRDIFENDKCKLHIKDYFNTCEDGKKALDLYSEITARRNLIVHNNGKVDSKYKKEVINSSFKEGEKIKITDDYLRGSIGLLLGIAAKTTELMLKNVLKAPITGTCLRITNSFNRQIKTTWFETLLNN